MDEKNIDIEISKIINWCNNKKISVFFKEEEDRIIANDKIIVINSKQNKQKKLFMLLHECGHYLIDQSKEKNYDTYKLKFGNGYDCDYDKNKKRTLSHKIDILSEEIEAWNRGYKLAIRLNINIDKKRFDKEKASAIKTYAKWASS